MPLLHTKKRKKVLQLKIVKRRSVLSVEPEYGTADCRNSPWKTNGTRFTRSFFHRSRHESFTGEEMGKKSLAKAKKIKNVALKRTRAVCASPILLCAQRVVLTARDRSADSRT